jgi:hypothetical protein
MTLKEIAEYYAPMARVPQDKGKVFGDVIELANGYLEAMKIVEALAKADRHCCNGDVHKPDCAWVRAKKLCEDGK